MVWMREEMKRGRRRRLRGVGGVVEDWMEV